MGRRHLALTVAVAVLALLVALPALAARPSTPPGQAKAKVEKSPITLSGTIEASSDAKGRPTYTLDQGGTTYTLHAGPPWYFGGDHPLAKWVGESVTIEGEVAEGSTDVDVLAIDGEALREPGKPPWAGGWKRVGNRHPGWSLDKADRFGAKFGDCFPPGHCKEKPGRGFELEQSPAVD